MGIQTAAGRFTPGSDIVECKGTFNGWQGGFVLTNDPTGANPNLFSGTTYIFDNPGTVEFYKFTVDGGYSGLGWESPASCNTLDRSFTETASPQTLPSVLWSDWKASDVLPATTTVTFQVNMTNAIGADGHVFNPDFPDYDLVYLNGDWMPWWSWGAPPLEMIMTNYPPGSMIYVISQTFNQGNSVPLTYKYSINGLDNEAAFATNHLRYIRTTGSYSLPLDTFGSQLHEASFGSLKIGQPSGGHAPISWLGRPGVHLQTATNLAASVLWQDLPATDGMSQTNYPVSPGQNFFRLINP